NKPPVVLTIAGFDPSAGAGVLADIKTISACGGYGGAAVTSLPLQKKQGGFGARHQNPDVWGEEIVRFVYDFDDAAVKNRMLPMPEIIKAVADFLTTSQIANVVIDPVIRSTSGFDLIDEVAVAALTECLFPLAAVVTPNVAEAERLVGFPLVNIAAMEQAAAAI